MKETVLKKKKKVLGVRGTGSAGSSAYVPRRRPACLCRPVGPPASGACPPARRSHCRMISSNACLCSRSRRLSSSEMWRFQRGKSAARRPDDMVHAARAPQRCRSERGLAAAARSMRRPAGAGRRAAPRSPPPAGRPRRHPGWSSGSCRK